MQRDARGHDERQTRSGDSPPARCRGRYPSARALRASASAQSLRSIAMSACSAERERRGRHPSDVQRGVDRVREDRSAASYSPSSTDAHADGHQHRRPEPARRDSTPRAPPRHRGAAPRCSRRRPAAAGTRASPRIVLPSAMTSSGGAVSRGIRPALGVERPAEVGIDRRRRTPRPPGTPRRGRARRTTPSNRSTVSMRPLANVGCASCATRRADTIGVAAGLRVLDRHLGAARWLRTTRRPGGGARARAPARAGFSSARADHGTGGDSGTTAGAGRAGRAAGSNVRAPRACSPNACAPSTASHSGPAHPVEHRGAGEERDFALAEMREQLGPQVVGHQSVVAGERRPRRRARRRPPAAPVRRGRGRPASLRSGRSPLA